MFRGSAQCVIMLSKVASPCVRMVQPPFSSRAFYERSAAIDKYRRRSKRLPVPDAFPLDLRIVSECAARRWWKTKIDRVAEVVPGEPQAQANRVSCGHTLNRMFASEDRA